MAAFDTTRTTYGATSAVSKIGSYFGTLVSSVVAWRDAAVTRKALNALTDRELEDIGLMRSDVDNVASSHFIR
ncbi:DUF1127 domain-containing protein [Sulfitobacter sp. JB4-11]|uniref:DUF1127 domain-containing protein n=1 Tax=Sulfitobacter rhodophyticola TaxID=3238304 RepID=UPI003514F68A